MNQHVAKKGEIPELFQTWQPVGEKLQLVMVHTVAIDRVRPYVPDQFKIVAIAPGVTLGYVFNGYFGPDSTLEYHEVAVAPALVRAMKHIGFYITHMYVDNENSLIGGRKMGLPKEMVEVVWKGLDTDCVRVFKDKNPLLNIHYKKFAGSVRFTSSANVLAPLEDKLFFCKNRLNSRWSLCKVSYEFPEETRLSHDLVQMNIGNPLISFAAKNMKGEMGADQRLIC